MSRFQIGDIVMLKDRLWFENTTREIGVLIEKRNLNPYLSLSCFSEFDYKRLINHRCIIIDISPSSQKYKTVVRLAKLNPYPGEDKEIMGMYIPISMIKRCKVI